MREAFHGADDVKATELLRITDDECEEPTDFDILDLLNGLKKHVYTNDDDDDDEQVGIFTRCVMWCEKYNRSWRLSQIHTLAMALEEGSIPEQVTTSPSDTMEAMDSKTEQASFTPELMHED